MSYVLPFIFRYINVYSFHATSFVSSTGGHLSSLRSTADLVAGEFGLHGYLRESEKRRNVSRSRTNTSTILVRTIPTPKLYRGFRVHNL